MLRFMLKPPRILLSVLLGIVCGFFIAYLFVLSKYLKSEVYFPFRLSKSDPHHYSDLEDVYGKSCFYFDLGPISSKVNNFEIVSLHIYNL